VCTSKLEYLHTSVQTVVDISERTELGSSMPVTERNSFVGYLKQRTTS